MSQFDMDESRLPHLVGLGAIVLTVLIFLVLLVDTQADFDFIIKLGDYLPFVVLILGVGFSFLLMAVTAATLRIKKHSTRVDKIQTALDKETTERLSAEDAKQQLEIALLQGQKLQAIGTLAGGIAHDFNNILYAIIGYAEMSQEDVEKDSQIYKNLGKVMEASKRRQELVARILAFSRRQHHDQEELDLNKAIEAALSLVRPAIPASVDIQFKATTDAMILGNQTQLHQILVNIINNAVDAMDDEGVITIELSHVAANDSILRSFASLAGGEYCKLEISDTGHGMDQQTIHRIFEPFYTTKEVGKGTGLGLSIVHSIVTEHKGEVVVTSKIGQGTKFMILLPLYSGKGA